MKAQQLLLLFLKIHKYFEGLEIHFYKILQNICGFSEKAKEVVELSKEKGFRVVLATSPLFQKIATESRMRWAGFKPTDFEIFTTFEDYYFSKPNINYYKEVISKLDVLPEECVMVGNDVVEDMVAKELGMKVFLLTDCLINRKEQDISEFANGNFDDLIEFVKNL